MLPESILLENTTAKFNKKEKIFFIKYSDLEPYPVFQKLVNLLWVKIQYFQYCFQF